MRFLHNSSRSSPVSSSRASCSDYDLATPYPAPISYFHSPFTHRRRGRSYLTPPTIFSAKICPRPKCDCCVHEKCPHLQEPYYVEAELFNPDKLKPLVMSNEWTWKKLAAKARFRFRKAPMAGLPHRPTCACEWCVEAKAEEVRELAHKEEKWYWRMLIKKRTDWDELKELCEVYRMAGSSCASTANSSGQSTPPAAQWIRYFEPDTEPQPHQWIAPRPNIFNERECCDNAGRDLPGQRLAMGLKPRNFNLG